MGGGDLFGIGQVGNGAADFKDAGVGAGGKPQVIYGLMEQAAG